MKLLIMNSLDEKYGSTYRIRAFAKELKKLGHKVIYYETSMPFLLKFLDMIRKSWNYDYEVLLIQKFNPLTIIPMLVAKLRRKKLIVDWDDWDTGLQKNIVIKALTWACETVGPYFPNLITSHNSVLLSLAPRFKQTLLLEQGYDEQLFLSNMNCEKTGSVIKIDDLDITVGYMCTFTHGGTLDLDEIFVAFSMVHNKKIKFMIIGGGELLEHFRNRANELHIQNIHFSGYVSHEKIPAFLSSFDIGLIYMKDISANYRRVSFKVIEYLAAGIAVVGNIVGETQKIFQKAIHHIPLSDLSAYLTKLDHDSIPISRVDEAQLESFQWTKIIQKLNTSLTGSNL